MANTIPIEELNEHVRYCSETGRFWWKPRDRKWFNNDVTWRMWNTRFAETPAFETPNTRGYHYARVNGVHLKAHRVAWALVHGVWPSEQIDHVDGDKSNNRISNLRVVPFVVNMKNLPRSTANKSGVTGVSWSRYHKKWCAQIGVNNRTRLIGRFRNFSDAVRARKKAEKRYGFHENHGR